MDTTYWIATELPTGDHFMFVTYTGGRTCTWIHISEVAACIENGATVASTGPGYNPEWDNGRGHWLIRGCSGEEYDMLVIEATAREALGGVT